MAAPALLFLSAGTAQAIQDISETFVAPPLIQDVSDAFIAPPLVQDVSERVPGVTVGAFNPQPETPGVIDPSSHRPQ